MTAWRFYFPDDGETAADATEVVGPRPYWTAEDIAREACEYDFSSRDGWERSRDTEFPCVVIAPDGTETQWTLWHEPTVDHRARPARAA